MANSTTYIQQPRPTTYPQCSIAFCGAISALALIIAAVAIGALFLPALAPVAVFCGTPVLISAAVVGSIICLVALVGAIRFAKQGDEDLSETRTRPLPDLNDIDLEEAEFKNEKDAVEPQERTLSSTSVPSQSDESFETYWSSKSRLVQDYCFECSSLSIAQHVDLITTHPLIENFKDKVIALFDLMNLNEDDTLDNSDKILLNLPNLLREMNTSLLKTYLQGNEKSPITTKDGNHKAGRLILTYNSLRTNTIKKRANIQKIINSIDLKKGFDPVDAGKILEAFNELLTA